MFEQLSFMRQLFQQRNSKLNFEYMLFGSRRSYFGVRDFLRRARVGAVLPVLAGIVFLTISCSRPGTDEHSAQNSAAAQLQASKWEGQLIRRPGSTAEDGKVYLVKEGKKHWVVTADWLKAHGYKFPEDVHVISAEDLGQVPEGEAVQ
jgi:hypothetical protein